MGISEMWPLSLLLLHTKLNTLFPSFTPLLEEFSLGDISLSYNKNLYNNVTRSNNDNGIYKSLKLLHYQCINLTSISKMD